MVLKFSYYKEGKEIKCEYKTPERLEKKEAGYRMRYLARMMVNYRYDHWEIEKKDWIGAWIYENDVCIAEVSYEGSVFLNETTDTSVLAERKLQMTDKIKAVVLGHAVADALGVPVEFCDRSEVDENPVTDMMGYGTYPYPEGSWSDDTSMSLCALDSLAKGEINYKDIMNNFIKWLNDGDYTPTGEAFDVGRTCLKSILIYSQTGNIESCGRTNEHSNGNGSLMRIHPVVLYLYTRNDLSLDEKINIIHNASALTHAHERAKVGCGIYSLVLWELLKKPDKESVLCGLDKAKEYYKEYSELNKYSRIFDNVFIDTKRSNISSSGYIVSTLEAALWCLLTTDSYSECVLKAVNLGEDTDTVGAVAGGLAGALYGYDSVPRKWLNTLKRKDYIEDMCERAAKSWVVAKG